MHQFRSQIIMSTLCLLALLVGYQKEFIQSSWASWRASLDAPEEESAAKEEVPLEKNAPAFPARKSNIRTLPPVQGPGAPTYQNPYGSLGERMKSQRQGTLRGTFDSLRQDKIEDKQKTKRNLYFERLSEQMKTMQGQAPIEELAPTPAEGETEAGVEETPLSPVPFNAEIDNAGVDFEEDFIDDELQPFDDSEELALEEALDELLIENQ